MADLLPLLYQIRAIATFSWTGFDTVAACSSRTVQGAEWSHPSAGRAIGSPPLGTILLAVALTACSSQPDRSSPSPTIENTPVVVVAADQAPPGPSEPTSNSDVPIGPTPTAIPTAVPKISRPGQPQEPTETALAQPFGRAVVYPDGVALMVTKVTTGVESGHGPGVFAGREFALFDLQLENESSEMLDMNAVAVTAAYGPDNLGAEPVYTHGADTVNFGGIVVPGASTTARYVFAVPESGVGPGPYRG